MKSFEHIDAHTPAEAAQALKSGAKAIAGGTDLVGVLQDKILPDYPEKVVNLKTIDGMEYIKETEKGLKIGANTKLSTIESSELIRNKYASLAQAAYSVASPLIRNLATIGGNLCQDSRCWYYRYPHQIGGRLECMRKGGDKCYAIQGDNRYHSIYGGTKVQLTPCTRNCPAYTDIPGYMEQLRAGNIAGAAQILMQANPIPSVTGRVCAHFCQDECNQTDSGDSVSIRNVERFLGDYMLKNKDKFYAPPKMSTGKKVAVVGSGPSGLSAAFYLRWAGNEVTVFDTKEEPGGMLMYAIPAYRLPKDIVRQIIAAYKDMGIKFVTNTRIGDKIKPAQIESDYDSVYYATGAWKRPVLGLAGEELTVFGLDFLVQVHDWMKGKIGKEVLVTGGGNVAMDVAVTAKRLGAKKVTLACLESLDEMPAGKSEIARAREEGIEIMPSWGLSKVISKNGKVAGMELMRCTSVRDAQGRFNPQYDICELKVVNAENILMSVGQAVDLSFLDEKYQLQLSKSGLIDVAEDTQMTSRPGIFAGGDATTGPKTVIQGIASGHNAARGMNVYLGVVDTHKGNDVQKPAPFLTFDLKGIQEEKGLKLNEIPLEKRDIDVEDEISPSEAAALAEAARCMNCGCYAVAPSDLANVLLCLNAVIETNKRTLSAEDFFTRYAKMTSILETDEFLTGVIVPKQKAGVVTAYDKFRERASIDFSIVSVASRYEMDGNNIRNARIVLGAVAPVPVRALEAETFLEGKPVTEETAAQAAELALAGAEPLIGNDYKVQIAKTLVKRSVLNAV